MIRIFNKTCVVASLLAVAACLASCRKESGSAESRDGMAELTVGLDAPTRADVAKSDSERKIYSADLFVYRDGRLENHSRAESSAGDVNSVSVRVTYGTKEIKVITNIPKEKADQAGRLAANYGAAPADLFLDNKPGALVHHGYLKNVAVSEKSKDVTVSLEANCARIVLNGIQNSLPASLGSLHVNRVFLMRVRGNPDGKGAAVWHNGNAVDANSDAGRLIVANVDRDVANGYDVKFADGGLVLYAFRNLAAEAVTATQQDDVTKLVVEAVVDGTTYWYPVGIPSIENNRSYEIDRLFITRTGSDDPNKYLTEKTLGVGMRVAPWVGLVLDPSHTGFERVFELVSEGGANLGVRSYEAGLTGLRPVAWRMTSLEVSRDGGQTWESADVGNLPWLAAKETSGAGRTDGTDPLHFTRDELQVTYPFRVTATQEGGRTASAVLSRPEYACTGMASGPFKFAILSTTSSYRAAGEVIPTKSGFFSAELPAVPENWGWVFHENGWSATNPALLSVDSHPRASSTVTSARGMFEQCPNLTRVADLPSGFKPTNCRAMFSGDASLAYAPTLNTSQAGDCTYFMYGCQSLLSIPEYDFSNATTLLYAFRNCYKLQRTKAIKAPKCTDFAGLFMECYELTDVPSIVSTNGESFYGVFMYCKSLTKVPPMDTSKGTGFMGMFQGCEKLVEVPALDTRNGTVFKDMFLYCTSLRTIPAIDTSKGTNFGDMFNYCVSLVEVPQLDTSNGTNFNNMFNSCTGIERIPLLDLRKATSVGGMFHNNVRLKDFGGMKGLALSVNLGMAYSLTHDSLVNIIDNLATVTGQTLTVGGGNLAKLSAAEKKRATDKGWTLN